MEKLHVRSGVTVSEADILSVAVVRAMVLVGTERLAVADSFGGERVSDSVLRVGVIF